MKVLKKGKEMSKKICFITTVSFTMDAFILDFAKYLKEQEDYDITLMCNPDPTFELKVPLNIKFIPMKVKRGLDFNLISNIYKYFKVFKNEKFDLIQYCTPNAALYSSLGGFFAGINNRLYTQWGIYYVGQTGIKRKIFKLMEKLTCKFSTIIEPDSKSNLKFSVLEGLYPEYKARLIGSGSSRGVNLSKFDFKKRNDFRKEIRDSLNLNDEFIFGYLGRINKDKGINELLYAFKDLNRDAKLILVGPNENVNELDEDIYNWSLNNKNIIYLPNTNEPYKYFSAFDVNVLPSYREGMPSAMLETMAMKTLIIASDINGINDVIEDNITGFLTQPRNFIDLKEKMQYAYDNFDKMNDIVENAYKKVSLEFEQKRLFDLIRRDRKEIFR